MLVKFRSEEDVIERSFSICNQERCNAVKEYLSDHDDTIVYDFNLTQDIEGYYNYSGQLYHNKNDNKLFFIGEDDGLQITDHIEDQGNCDDLLFFEAYLTFSDYGDSTYAAHGIHLLNNSDKIASLLDIDNLSFIANYHQVFSMTHEDYLDGWIRADSIEHGDDFILRVNNNHFGDNIRASIHIY